MKEFTCIVCGEKGIDNSWNRMRRGGYKGYQACKFNIGISCIEEKCENCGWNPAVAQKRKEAIV